MLERPAPVRGVVFRNRHAERQLFDQLIDAVLAGESRALVLRGEAGVGKTALLEDFSERVRGCRVVQVTGVQSEMELAFAGVHQLCAPMLDVLTRIPAGQQEALGTALGVTAGPPPDRFLVGLAVLGLLAEAARDRPLVCLIDDAQWLDRASAQTMAFVARRLRAESVGMVFAVRDPYELADFAGVEEVRLAGLPEDDARELLKASLRGPVDQRVIDRFVAEARGNPLALLELPRGFTPAELVAGFGSSGGVSLPSRIKESYRRQLAGLPAETRRLLGVAAAEPIGDPVLLWRAAERLGIGMSAASPVEAAGLVDFGAQIRFRHPLLRSVAYRETPAAELREAHRVLGEVTDPEADPDRRAWHFAQATAGPDEDVAVELERSAGRARARGGLAAAAAFLHRATELTAEPARRGERALAAGQATLQAGTPESALRLLAVAEASQLNKLEQAQVALLRAQIRVTMNRGGDAAFQLLNAAKQLAPLDVRLARDTYSAALTTASFALHLAGSSALREVAEAARSAPPPPQPPRASDLLLDAIAIRFSDGYAAAVPALRRAVQAFLDQGLAGDNIPTFLWFGFNVIASDLWDDRAWETFTGRFLRLARDVGALALLPIALTAAISWHVFAGELDMARMLLEEQEAVTRATGIPAASYGTTRLAAWQGDEVAACNLLDRAVEENARRGEGAGVLAAHGVTALLYNSLGRYEEALAAAQRVTEHPVDYGMPTWFALVEQITAASRCGQPERAAGAFRRLTRLTQVSGTDWALGLEARCRALLADGEAAESAYREAIERLARTRIRGELARAHLHYGEWLRRERRRGDARKQLGTAHQMFTTMGMEAFAAQAARELSATGASVRKHVTGTTAVGAGGLTPQEAQIVRLVREGLTNSEIGVRLFLSSRTVEWHLSRIFPKLGITSRRQLLDR